MELYPCPCCGFLMFSGPPGTYEICEICFWEDDSVQLRFLNMGGANHVSLIQAQKNFAAIGACEERLHEYTRPPLSSEERDPLWRPVDLMVDQQEKLDLRKTYFELATEDYPDGEALYYWRK